VVVHLHAKVVVVQDIRSLITIVLDPLSTKYPWWHNMMLLTLRRYTLDNHVLTDKIDITTSWYHYDGFVLTWMLDTLSVELQEIIHEPLESAR
jgi:hypothetical protein